MDILLKVLKEIGIAIVLLAILAGVTVFAFKDQIPFDTVVPEGEEYVLVDRTEYSVSSSDRLAEVEAVTITHKTEGSQIIQAENDVRIQSGKYTPFGTIDSTSDLPSEKIGTSISQEGTDENGTSSENTGNTGNTETNTNSGANTNTNTSTSTNTNTNSEEKLEYPETPVEMIEEDVEKIREDESESAEDAANRRFNNTEE